MADYFHKLLLLLLFYPDGDMEWKEEEMLAYPPCLPPAEDDATDFDYLLQQAQQKLCHKR